jgi:flagellin
MRINHNIAALNTHRQLGAANNAQMKNMEKLSSGLRINRAADDAAGLSISEKMRGQIRGLEQASKNAQDGISLIQTAEGALNEVSDILVRMKELFTQKENGTYNGTDTANIDAEVEALTKEIENIGKNTKFNDIPLLDGTLDIKIQIGHTEDDKLDVVLGTDISGIKPTTLDGTTTQIDAVSTARSTLGALQNRLEHTVNNLNNNVENLTAAESRIRDTDMAKEMMAQTKNSILSQASQAMLAQANQQPQGVLQLLR